MFVQYCDVCGKVIQSKLDLFEVVLNPVVSYNTRETKYFDVCDCCIKQIMLFLMKNEKPQEMSETLQ